MLDNLYQAIVTGGFARLTTVANAFTNNNSFNSFLPTSTITTTSSTTQIAPISVLNTLYGKLAAGGVNTNNWLGTNNFQGAYGSVTFVNLPTTTTSLTSAFQDQLITKNVGDQYYVPMSSPIATPSTITSQNSGTQYADPVLILRDTYNTKYIKFLLNALVSTANPSVVGSDTVIYSNDVLNLTTDSTTACGVRITDTTVNLTGTDVNVDATTSINLNKDTFVTTPDTGTTTSPALTVSNSETTPSFIKFLINASAVSPNLTAGDDAIYSNGVLNLTTTSASACNIRISSTDVALKATTTTLDATTNNINGTTNINGTCIVKGAQTGSVLDAQMAIINSVTPNPNSINFACNLSAGNYNSIVQTGDSAIFSGLTVGTSNLVLTTHSNSANGIRIDASNNDVSIYGSTTSLNGTALAVSSSTATTFVNLPSTTTTFTTATANQFITKNIGDTSYLQPLTGGYARLTTVNNTFTNSNAFDGGITSFAATTSITCNAGATINGTWTYTLIPFINVNATGADLDEAMNWRTTIAQIGVGITNLKAAINTWAASNTFSTFLTTNEPFNLVFNASKTYGNQSFGFQKNNQNFQIANTGSINVYKNGAIMLLEQKWGVWLIHFQISLNVAANAVIHIGIGNLSGIPQTHSIVTGQTSVANAAFCLQTSIYYQNTSITAPGQSMYGVVKSTILNTVVNSVDIRFVRIG